MRHPADEAIRTAFENFLSGGEPAQVFENLVDAALTVSGARRGAFCKCSEPAENGSELIAVACREPTPATETGFRSVSFAEALARRIGSDDILVLRSDSRRTGCFVLDCSGLSIGRDCMPPLQALLKASTTILNAWQERLERDRMLDHAARLEWILDESPTTIIATDYRDRINYFNKAAERMYGRTREEALGMGTVELYNLMSDRAFILENIWSDPINLEAETKRKDGDVFLSRLALRVMRDESGAFAGSVGYSYDITEEKRAQQEEKKLLGELEKLARQRKELLDRMDLGVLSVGSDGNIEFANRFFCELFESDSSKLVNVPWEKVLPIKASARRTLRSMLANGTEAGKRLTIQVDSSDGASRMIELAVEHGEAAGGARLLLGYDRTELHDLRLRNQERSTYKGIVTQDDAMAHVCNLIDDIGRVDVTVLIEGETGTGKELVARALHEASPRKNGPFLAINCATLTNTLGQSHLFGHRKGSFTGAIADRRGAFEEAAGGTVFLDEISEIPIDFQAVLLRMLQEREVIPLGELHARKVDVRVIAATNKNLRELVQAGEFREDLYFRVQVAGIAVPPLRHRRNDIPLLAEHFLSKIDHLHRRAYTQIDASAMNRLVSYHWPGNVRQLKNVIETAAILCRGDRILTQHLPTELLMPAEPATDSESGRSSSYGATIEDRIRVALRQTHGNKSAAAKLLGIGRATLYRHLDRSNGPDGVQ